MGRMPHRILAAHKPDCGGDNRFQISKHLKNQELVIRMLADDFTDHREFRNTPAFSYRSSS